MVTKNQSMSKQEKRVEELLENILLPKDIVSEIQSKEIINQFKNLILDNNIFLRIIKFLFEYDTNVEKQLKEKKIEKLLIDIFDKVKEHENKLLSLFKLLFEPKGKYLLWKALKNNENYYDTDMNEVTKSIILKIIESDFTDLFDYHEYYIDIINKLSKISLKIVLNFKNWSVDISGPSLHISNDYMITNWEKRFSNKYADINGMISEIEKDIIFQCIIELRDKRIIEYSSDRKVVLTKSGERLFGYLSF